MFRTLKLEHYRSFESYELSDLTRVNLLVGKNNCGKTSILEAVNLLVSGGSPSVIEQGADRRGEMNVREDPEPYGLEAVPDVSHLFFGRIVEPGVGLHLSSNADTRSLSIEFADVDDVMEGADGRDIDEMLPLFDDDTSDVLALVTKVDGRSSTPFLPVSEDGSVLAMPRSRRMRLKNAPAAPVVQFVTAESLYPESMRGAWDKVLADGRESDVVEALRILDGELDTIHFLTHGFFRGSSERAGVLIGLRTGQRVPLGSCGDGMRRLLALSLSVVRAADGFVLIDEIDTGLHWTAMEETWRLIVTAARRSNVQVFATTHSYDCVRGLASLVESFPDLAPEVSIQKIDRLLGQAVSLDADKIRIALAQDMEVR